MAMLVLSAVDRDASSLEGVGARDGDVTVRHHRTTKGQYRSYR